MEILDKKVITAENVSRKINEIKIDLTKKFYDKENKIAEFGINMKWILFW